MPRFRFLSGVSVSNDVAHWSVRPEAIYAEFRTSGPHINRRHNLFSLDLEQIDKVIGWLDATYKGVALAEGAATGTAGALGIAADIPALVTLRVAILY